MSDHPGNNVLSLKVMRVSRPELASTWQPFYSSSPSFSAHSTASILSLQGTTPLPGHPKTLRDLTNAGELLVLPSSFGSIQLGETFSSCICVNNEAQIEVGAVSLKVEMQTATTKILLAGKGGAEHALAMGDTMETIIHHEIKEMGQHVLACTVTYRLPPGARNVPGATGDPNDPTLQTFRKFYKFAVTNPLSVKTKVHVPRSPVALHTLSERDKVFLEVHIQNLTQSPIHFERMQLICADGWNAETSDTIDANDDRGWGSISNGLTGLLQPQDTYQYIYILTPTTESIFPVVYAAGSTIPLGRLDIAWRSTFGEPGRLLTSILSRRIPLPTIPVQQPASALPLYLKRTVAAPSPISPRPHSPQLSQSRPATPPPARPGSPSWPRTTSAAPPRSQSPQQLPLTTHTPPDISITLVIRHFPSHAIAMEKPFKITLALALSTSMPLDKEHQRRLMTLVVQHQQPAQALTSPLAHAIPETFSPRLPSSGFSTPPSTIPNSFNYALAHQKLLAVSPRQSLIEEPERYRLDPANTNTDLVILPPPFFEGADELSAVQSPGVIFVGSSAVFLPPVELLPAADAVTRIPGIAGTDQSKLKRWHAVQEFELTYIPTQPGLITIGGLRVLLVDDKLTNADGLFGDESKQQSKRSHAHVLREWGVIAEAWVAT
ncbi:hypothetical protein BD779DRAFT_1660406 [Infundibulicybe gibba]|nr:hypothetical protein BD779DRAFT_1660406 [Infundibulicybe gibba]